MRGLFGVFLLALLLAISVNFSHSAPRKAHLSNQARDKFDALEEFEQEREQDRKKLAKKKDAVVGNIPQAGELFEGDMIMDDDLRRAVLGEADKRSILSDPDKKWPGGVVPFVFSENISPRSKRCVLKAMKSFHRHTCIRFVARTKQKDYVLIKSNPNLCMSHVGRRGGQQDVTIGHGCTRLGTCQHELLHALGTIHEQSRPDRDDHVTIVWNNIKESTGYCAGDFRGGRKFFSFWEPWFMAQNFLPDFERSELQNLSLLISKASNPEKEEKHNFNKYSYDRVVTEEDVPYNYASVMHYPNHAFAIDRDQATIIANKDPSLTFGQRTMFSVGDVKAVNRRYSCPPDRYSSELVQTLSDAEVIQRRDLREDLEEL